MAKTKEYRRNRKDTGDMATVEETDLYDALLDRYYSPWLPPLDVTMARCLVKLTDVASVADCSAEMGVANDYIKTEASRVQRVASRESMPAALQVHGAVACICLNL
ncbi:hypothetical protein NUW58_g9982 [Xylaria curta]|uniref:Uncharacterized protein n=1 Tax=Xylaria curta TaxID=42375 RepID=A0ACC1MSZ4_9PEZI|nr:hypothetical protein NUW58_g9982 [Xylaria curta]